MATNLSSNKYVGEIKAGDCVCVRGHKPIAMGEILVVNALGPVDSVHVGLGADHGVVGAYSAGHSMNPSLSRSPRSGVQRVAWQRSMARSRHGGCGFLRSHFSSYRPYSTRHRGTSEKLHQLALRPPRAPLARPSLPVRTRRVPSGREPPTAACVKKTLANPEPSTHGPYRR
jgi:hypothetical protein